MNTMHIIGADGTRAEDLTRAEVEARKQADSVMKFLKKHVAGWESAYIIDTAPYIGVRESRRIVGEYTLTKDDVLQGKKFDDAIVHSLMSIDQHGPGEGHNWINLEELASSIEVEAAGAAATTSSKVPPRKVGIKKLQEALRKERVIL